MYVAHVDGLFAVGAKDRAFFAIQRAEDHAAKQLPPTTERT